MCKINEHCCIHIRALGQQIGRIYAEYLQACVQSQAINEGRCKGCTNSNSVMSCITSCTMAMTSQHNVAAGAEHVAAVAEHREGAESVLPQAGCYTTLQPCRPAAAAGNTMRMRQHIRGVLLHNTVVARIEAYGSSRKVGRDGVVGAGIPTTLSPTPTTKPSPLLFCASSSSSNNVPVVTVALH